MQAEFSCSNWLSTHIIQYHPSCNCIWNALKEFHHRFHYNHYYYHHSNCRCFVLQIVTKELHSLMQLQTWLRFHTVCVTQWSFTLCEHYVIGYNLWQLELFEWKPRDVLLSVFRTKDIFPSGKKAKKLWDVDGPSSKFFNGRFKFLEITNAFI